jgi:hypothetical protein
MRFRGLFSTFPPTSRPRIRSLLLTACCLIVFVLSAGAAGPNSGSTLHIEVSVAPTVQTTGAAPALAAPSSVTASASATSVASDSSKEIDIEWRLLPQNVSSGTHQVQVFGVAHENHPAVLETFTVVSP